MVMKRKKLKQLLTAENAFVSNLLLLCDVPDPDNDDEDVLDDTEDPKSAKRMKLMLKKTPAELKAAAEASNSKKEEFVKNRKTKNPNQKKNKASRKEKRMMGKMIKVPKEEVVTVKKEVKEEKTSDGKKFNEGEKIIFNKIDFDSTKKRKGGINNPQKALEKLNETKAKIRGMMNAGETEKALAVKSGLAWKKAFERNEGKKVKDNKFALKKSIDRREAQKKKSAKEWQDRKTKVQGKIEARAKQVEENKKKKMQEKLKKKQDVVRVLRVNFNILHRSIVQTGNFSPTHWGASSREAILVTSKLHLAYLCARGSILTVVKKKRGITGPLFGAFLQFVSRKLRRFRAGHSKVTIFHHTHLRDATEGVFWLVQRPKGGSATGGIHTFCGINDFALWSSFKGGIFTKSTLLV